MAICFNCKKSDQVHEVKMPSKRYELKNGKRIETCSGFQPLDPKLIENLNPKKVELPVELQVQPPIQVTSNV